MDIVGTLEHKMYEDNDLLNRMTLEQQTVTLAVKRLVEDWIVEHFGKRCQKPIADCEVCLRWAAFDDLFAGTEKWGL